MIHRPRMPGSLELRQRQFGSRATLALSGPR